MYHIRLQDKYVRLVTLAATDTGMNLDMDTDTAVMDITIESES